METRVLREATYEGFLVCNGHSFWLESKHTEHQFCSNLFQNPGKELIHEVSHLSHLRLATKQAKVIWSIVNKSVLKCICSYKRTWNFFPGFAISNSDICRRGQSAFTPPGICTIAPKLSTERIFAFTTIPGLTSEWVNTASSKALACKMWKHKDNQNKHPAKWCSHGRQHSKASSGIAAMSM